MPGELGMTPWAMVAPGLWVLKSSILHITDDLRMWRGMRAEERVRERVCVCVLDKLVTLAVCSQGLPGIGGPRGLQGGWTVIDATKKCTELGIFYVYMLYIYIYIHTHIYMYTTYTCSIHIYIYRWI